MYLNKNSNENSQKFFFKSLNNSTSYVAKNKEEKSTKDKLISCLTTKLEAKEIVNSN